MQVALQPGNNFSFSSHYLSHYISWHPLHSSQSTPFFAPCAGTHLPTTKPLLHVPPLNVPFLPCQSKCHLHKVSSTATSSMYSSLILSFEVSVVTCKLPQHCRNVAFQHVTIFHHFYSSLATCFVSPSRP